MMGRGQRQRGLGVVRGAGLVGQVEEVRNLGDLLAMAFIIYFMHPY